MSLMPLSQTTPIVAYSPIVPAVRIDREKTPTVTPRGYQPMSTAWQGVFDKELALSKYKDAFMQGLFLVTSSEMGESLEDLNPLDRILHKGSLEANEAIRKALTKKEGYFRRLFTTESWEEWTEKRTSLGKVVRVFSDYLKGSKLDNLCVKRLDRQTILKANAEAAILLQQFDRAESTLATETQELKGKVTENPAPRDNPMAASSIFSTISSSFWSVTKYIRSSLISIDRQFSFPVVAAKKIEINTILDALQDAKKFTELKETIDKIVQNKPVENEDTWWDKFVSVIEVAKDPTSWYENLVQDELKEIVTQRLYELHEKYTESQRQIDKFLRVRTLQRGINQMSSIMQEINQEMETNYNTIADIEATMEQIVEKLQTIRDEALPVQRLRDEAQERVNSGAARMRQIDQEITRQYNAAVALAQARVGFHVPLSMLNRNNFVPPFAAEVQEIYDRVKRDEKLIEMHNVNIEKYNQEVRTLNELYDNTEASHNVWVENYKTLEQLMKQGEEKIEGWEKEKQEL